MTVFIMALTNYPGHFYDREQIIEVLRKWTLPELTYIAAAWTATAAGGRCRSVRRIQAHLFTEESKTLSDGTAGLTDVVSARGTVALGTSISTDTTQVTDIPVEGLSVVVDHPLGRVN